MKKYLFILCLAVSGFNCNSYNDKMNTFLKQKKNIEIIIDSNYAKQERFRLITGYDEIYDSITLNKVYPHPELVDSIWFLKQQNPYLINELEKVKYSIDSLQKLK